MRAEFFKLNQDLVKPNSDITISIHTVCRNEVLKIEEQNQMSVKKLMGIGDVQRMILRLGSDVIQRRETG
jgi:hypothetical protein